MVHRRIISSGVLLVNIKSIAIDHSSFGWLFSAVIFYVHFNRNNYIYLSDVASASNTERMGENKKLNRYSDKFYIFILLYHGIDCNFKFINQCSVFNSLIIRR